MMRRWYLQPEFQACGIYEGVHLGECAEYNLYLDLLRVLKSRCQTDSGIEPELHRLARRTDSTLVRKRRTRCLSFQQLADSSHRERRDFQRPTVLIAVRAQNIAVAAALQATEAFDLVVEGNIEMIAGSLDRAGIRYQSFDDFITPEVRSDSEARVRQLFPRWMQAVQSPSVRSAFSTGRVDLFPDIEDRLHILLHEAFCQETLCIEGLRNLIHQRGVVLFVTWNDSLPPHRALTLYAQQRGIPTLHISHAVHGMQPTNEVIYADRTAVYGEHSRELYLGREHPAEKVIVTGNPDWDKYAHMPRLWKRDEVCRRLGLEAEKRTVLFATFFIPDPLSSVGRSRVERFYRSLLRSVKELQKTYPIQLAVKLHPAEWEREPWYRRIAVEEGVDRLVIASGGLEEFLFVSDVVICRGSNIGFEALLLGKPVISYEATLYGEGQAVIVIENTEELTPTIEKSLFDDRVRHRLEKHRKRAIRRFNHLGDGKATHRVMRIIERMTGVQCVIPETFVALPPPESGQRKDKKGSPEAEMDSLLRSGDIADARGEWEKALEIYQRARSRCPSSTEPSTRLGRVLLKAGRIEGAIQVLTDLLAVAPGAVEPRLLLALAHQQQKTFACALDHLNMVAESASASPEEKGLAYQHAARCRRAMGDFREAEKCYQESLRLNPDAGKSLKELGSLYVEQGKLHLAEEALRQAVALDGQDSEARNDLGVVLSHMGQVEEGKTFLEEVVRTDPEYVDALLNLVELEKTGGNAERALSLVNRFLSNHPDDPRGVTLQDDLKRQGAA